MLSTLAVVAVVGSVVSQQPETGVSAEAAAWVKARGVPLKTCEAGNGFEDMAGLKSIVGGARIVSLGEPTHGTREAFQLKHRLMEYLATEMGFRVFSIEANMPESYKLNEYVLEGKGDPRELIGGMYFWTWNTEEVLAMVEWMKGFNEAGRAREGAGFVPLRFTGFDMQTPDVAATITVDGVRAVDPAMADEMKELYGKLPEIRRQAAGMQGRGNGTAIMVGGFPVEAAKGKKVRVSAWIRTKDVGGFAGWWFRCDKADNTPGAFNNMADFGPKGTTEWKRYEFTLDAPVDTVNINFGPLIVGSGEAWFDDVEIELDGVVYADPAKFSFDFENPEVKYLTATTPGTRASRVKEGVHGGTTCLYLGALIEKEPEKKVDPAEVETKTGELVARLKGMRPALVAKHGEKQAEWVIQNARVVAQCARMFAAGDMGGAVRDESMADNVKWILDQDPGAKIVLWAHNGHVSRSESYGQKWMGAHLSTMFPGQGVVFGFATGSGRYTAIAPGEGLKSDNTLEEPPAGSVEAYVASAGAPVLMLDLRGAATAGPGAAWVGVPTQMRSIGAMATQQQFYPQNLAESYDVLLYIAKSTASRPLR